MKQPFTQKEICETIYLLKKDKSTGCDGITDELLKSSPDSAHSMIAEIYNEADTTRDGQVELILGTLNIF